MSMIFSQPRIQYTNSVSELIALATSRKPLKTHSSALSPRLSLHSITMKVIACLLALCAMLFSVSAGALDAATFDGALEGKNAIVKFQAPW